VNSETSAALGGTLSYTGSSQGATNVGSYIITPGGQVSSNYIISYIDSNLEIEQQTLEAPVPTPIPLPTLTSVLTSAPEPSIIEIGGLDGSTQAEAGLEAEQAGSYVEFGLDGDVTLVLSDSTQVTGISMPDTAIAIEGDTLVISRQRPDNGTPSGGTTVVTVAMLNEDEPVTTLGNYVVMDGETEITVTPYDGSVDTPTEPGEILGTIDFNMFDGEGNAIGYTVSYTENGLVISPKNSVATLLLEERPDLVLGLAMIELQKIGAIEVNDIKKVFLSL